MFKVNSVCRSLRTSRRLHQTVDLIRPLIAFLLRNTEAVLSWLVGRTGRCVRRGQNDFAEPSPHLSAGHRCGIAAFRYRVLPIDPPVVASGSSALNRGPPGRTAVPPMAVRAVTWNVWHLLCGPWKTKKKFLFSHPAASLRFLLLLFGGNCRFSSRLPRFVTNVYESTAKRRIGSYSRGILLSFYKYIWAEFVWDQYIPTAR